MLPHLEDPIDIGAQIVKGLLHRARVFNDLRNLLAYPDFLYKRFLSEQGLHFILPVDTSCIPW